MIKKDIKNSFKKIIQKAVKGIFGVDSYFYAIVSNETNLNLFYNKNIFNNSKLGVNAKIYSPYKSIKSNIGNYTYIAENAKISNTNIGKFCSIGPNLISGWGIHPLNGISTHPMFYSTLKQNGITLSSVDKIDERKSISIGNDVFIGMNVSILDGVTIGDGAVIGAGAIVSKDIPSFAIAVGSPIRIIGYRFSETSIKDLLDVKWWDFEFEELQQIEENFFNVEEFLKINKKQKGGI